MLAAASLQLHRPAVPLQHARAPSCTASGRRPHARLLLHRVSAAAEQQQEQPDESSAGNSSSGSGSQPKCGRGGGRDRSGISGSRELSSTNQAFEASSLGIEGTDRRQRVRAPNGRFIRHTAARQPQLQAWLQQKQGLLTEAADQHVRRLAHIFGSQQAALDSLPATFEWCRSRGLTGLQTAQLLDRIAKKRRENVVRFATSVQPVWQQLDSHIAAWAELQRQAGDSKLRKHASLAEALCSNNEAAQALGMPPGHVQAWLAAVSQQLPGAAVGRLLLSQPILVTGSPRTASAAISWAADVLGVADLAAFLPKVPMLLKSGESTLQRNLDSLQQALGWTAGQAQQLALKQPRILNSSPATVQTALAWLQQLFPDAEQLAAIVDRGPLLLTVSVQQLQGNADYLRQALGWQDGDGQLAAFVATYPHPFATVDLSSKKTQHKLRLLSEVVGVSAEECLGSGSGYLSSGLDRIAARYMLARERAPDMLFNRHGEPHLSWIVDVSLAKHRGRLGLSDQQYRAFMRQWPRSEQGRRLLEGLRAGSVDGWPRPPVPGALEQQQWAEAEQRRQARAEGTQVAAAAMDGKRRGRGRPRKAEGGGNGEGGATTA